MAWNLKVAIASGALAAVLATAGCTSSGGGTHPTPSKDATSTPTTPSAALPSTSVGWAASGTARNPSKSSASYRITVFFTTDHATVIGHASTTVTVPGGASHPWTVAATFHPASPTRCVLRGVG
jgi:hypothetical protein